MFEIVRNINLPSGERIKLESSLSYGHVDHKLDFKDLNMNELGEDVIIVLEMTCNIWGTASINVKENIFFGVMKAIKEADKDIKNKAIGYLRKRSEWSKLKLEDI